MRRFRKRIALAVLLCIVLLMPMKYELDDGGTVGYNAILWQLKKQHQMWQVDGINGYLTGTVVNVLWIEIYNDVAFIPAMKENSF